MPILRARSADGFIKFVAGVGRLVRGLLIGAEGFWGGALVVGLVLVVGPLRVVLVLVLLGATFWRIMGAEAPWFTPLVLRMEGLSALGLNLGSVAAIFAGGGVSWLPVFVRRVAAREGMKPMGGMW